MVLDTSIWREATREASARLLGPAVVGIWEKGAVGGVWVVGRGTMAGRRRGVVMSNPSVFVGGEEKKGAIR